MTTLRTLAREKNIGYGDHPVLNEIGARRINAALSHSPVSRGAIIKNLTAGDSGTIVGNIQYRTKVLFNVGAHDATLRVGMDHDFFQDNYRKGKQKESFRKLFD